MSSRSYRSDIDGLRAIAVIIVVFYHAPLGFHGGYVGVDVFFVISGFLITSLIVSDLEQGQFSLLQFWERRIRRIYPALCLTVLVTLLAGWFLLLPIDYAALCKSAVAQGLLVSNFHFWQTSDYFGIAAEDRPLLHTWSLAVEEQFYIVLPFVLTFLFRKQLVRRNVKSAWAMGLVCLVGLSISQFGVMRLPSAAFYLLPFRAWELLLGVTIALLPTKVAISRPMVREFLAALGIVGILVPAWLYTQETPFPGIAAALPGFATALLIWVNRPVDDAAARHQTLTGRLLSHRAIVFIGLISYSLYLWHWPIFVFAKYWSFSPLWRLQRIGLVTLAFVLAVITWKYVEQPFRQKKIKLTRIGVFTTAGILTASIIGFALFVQSNSGIPTRFPEQVIAILPLLSPDSDATMANQLFVQREFNFMRFGPDSANNQTPDFIVWGDSHAKCALPAFEEFCKESGRSGIAAIRYATAPVTDEDFLRTQDNIKEGATTEVINFINNNRIKDTFLVARWEKYQLWCGKERLKRAMRDTIDTLSKTGTRVWVVGDVPSHDAPIPRALARNILFSLNDDSWRRKTSDHMARNLAFYELSTEPSIANFIDPSVYLREDNSDSYRVTENGALLYMDGDHLTRQGAMAAIASSLQQRFFSSYLVK